MHSKVGSTMTFPCEENLALEGNSVGLCPLDRHHSHPKGENREYYSEYIAREPVQPYTVHSNTLAH